MFPGWIRHENGFTGAMAMLLPEYGCFGIHIILDKAVDKVLDPRSVTPYT
jgi:hypothetical protein